MLFKTKYFWTFTQVVLSRLPLKSVPLLVPLLVRAAFGGRSAVDVTGFLATTDPLFIFHLFCLCLTHLSSLNQLLVYYWTLCSPCCVCEWLLIIIWSVFVGSWCYFVNAVFLSKIRWLLVSAVLRLTLYTSYAQDPYSYTFKTSTKVGPT